MGISNLNDNGLVIAGVVEHADFREAEGQHPQQNNSQGKLGGLGGRILGAPLKLLSTDPFKSATSGNSPFFLPTHVKAPWKQSKYAAQCGNHKKLSAFPQFLSGKKGFRFSH